VTRHGAAEAVCRSRRKAAGRRPRTG